MKSAPALVRALVYGGVAVLVVSVAGSIIGYLVAGGTGVASALSAAALTAFFLGLTTASVLIADRVSRDQPGGVAYFGIIIGVWFVKFIVFILALVFISRQPWVDAYVFFFSMIAAVVGSLVADIVAVAGAQVSAVSAAPVKPVDEQASGEIGR